MRKRIVHVSFQPYITKAYFEMDKPPINLTRIAIGDGTLGSVQTSIESPVVTVLETYPQIIGYDTQVFEYFQEQYVQEVDCVFLECLFFHLGVNFAGTISPCNILNLSIFHL